MTSTSFRLSFLFFFPPLASINAVAAVPDRAVCIPRTDRRTLSSLLGPNRCPLQASADWYATIPVGIAGGTMPANTGSRPPDALDLWDAIMDGSAGPRTEARQLQHAFWEPFLTPFFALHFTRAWRLVLYLDVMFWACAEAACNLCNLMVRPVHFRWCTRLRTSGRATSHSPAAGASLRCGWAR